MPGRSRVAHSSPFEQGAPLRRLALPAIALAIIVGACADGVGSGAASVEALPRLVLDEELRIGSVDDPDTGFAMIADVDLDRDGNVYVFEGQASHIRVYDASGRLVRTIGRKGSGPGEFERSAQFGVKGDTVWAWDVFRRRMTLFDRRGTLLAANRIDGLQIQLQNPGSLGWVMPRWMRDDGLLVGELTLFSGGRRSGDWPVKPTDTLAVPRLLYTVSGDIVDTIGWDARPPRDESAIEWVEVGGTRYLVPRPPGAERLTASLIDGRVVASVPPPASDGPAAFTVTRLGLQGDTIWSRRLQYRPMPYDAATLDALAWQSARTPGGVVPMVGGVARVRPTPADSMDVFRRVRAAIDFPEHQLPVQLVRVHDEAIWLLREDGDSSDVWLLIDTAGTPLGTVELPGGVRVILHRGETLWASVPDELDVPWLVRYRLRPVP